MEEGEWNDRSMRAMVMRLEHEYHQIVRSIVFHSAMLLNEAASVDRGAATAAIRHSFRKLSERLILHIEKEEHLFFPTLLLLEAVRGSGEAPPVPHGDVARNVELYRQQHEEIARELADLVHDSERLEISGHLASTLRGSVSALERHVRQCLNFENCIVFPRAVALEDDVQHTRRLSPRRTTDKKGGRHDPAYPFRTIRSFCRPHRDEEPV